MENEYSVFYRLEHAGEQFLVICGTKDMAVEIAAVTDKHGAQCGCCAPLVRDPSGNKLPKWDGAQRLA